MRTDVKIKIINNIKTNIFCIILYKVNHVNQVSTTNKKPNSPKKKKTRIRKSDVAEMATNLKFSVYFFML